MRGNRPGALPMPPDLEKHDVYEVRPGVVVGLLEVEHKAHGLEDHIAQGALCDPREVHKVHIDVDWSDQAAILKEHGNPYPKSVAWLLAAYGVVVNRGLMDMQIQQPMLTDGVASLALAKHRRTDSLMRYAAQVRPSAPHLPTNSGPPASWPTGPTKGGPSPAKATSESASQGGGAGGAGEEWRGSGVPTAALRQSRPIPRPGRPGEAVASPL